MATIQTPKINRIYKMTEFDVLRTSVKMGNMYMCVDSQNLYFDKGTTSRDRQLYPYTGIRTRNEMLYNITPTRGVSYYCWEDNSLWYWNNKWEALYCDTSYPSAYVYDDMPTSSNPSEINSIYRYDMPNMPADDNGLLKDGSVVVRDRNRIIKGKIYVNDENNNMTISSYLGGGLRFLPNGKTMTDGELWIGDVSKEVNGELLTFPLATLRAELTILNNEMYINYAEHPEADISQFPKENHIYKVFHEGNLDTSAIITMTPQEVYNKLLDDSLPNVFNFNVKKLEGHTADYFARKTHTHSSSDITDLYNTVVEQSGIAVRSIFNNIDGHGITGSYNTVRNVLTLDVNDFTLSFSGGATGSGRITDLGDTTIQLTVDPDKHSHTNYETTMTSLQNQIDAINYDINTSYSKNEIDIMINNVTGTATPTANKPLLVNAQGILPGIVSQALQLNHYIDITIDGAVTGTARVNGSETALTITTALGSSGTISNMIDTQINARGVIVPIGDGSSTTYTVRHNLGTQHIIVQFRDLTTLQQVYLSNKIIDNNVIEVESTTPIANGNVEVVIYKVA